MSSLATQIIEHPLNEQLERLVAQVRMLSPKTLDELTELDMGWLPSRAEKVVEYISGVVNGVEPDLVPLNQLNAISSAADHSNTIATQLDTNINQAQDFSNSLDALVLAISPLASLVSLQKEATAAGEQYGQAASRSLRELREELTETQNELEGLERSREEEVANLEEIIEQLRAEIEQQKQQVQNVTNEFQSQFSKAQETRAAEWDVTRKEAEAELSAEIQKLTDSNTETMQAASDETSERLEEIEAIKQKVDAVYQAIGQTATAGAFNATAQRERQTADTLRKWAVIAGFAAVLVAFAAAVFVFVLPETSTTPAAITTKIALVLTVGVLAGYLGKQSGFHRRREVRGSRP